MYATAETWNGIEAFAITDRDRRVLRHRHPSEIAGIGFEAIAVEHSIRAPAVGYRITAGESMIRYVPDVVFTRERAAALLHVSLYVGDGASIDRPLVRRRGQRLIGHASISAQLTWCRKAGIGQAIITHCGSGIVGAEPSAAVAIRKLGEKNGVATVVAHDGIECAYSDAVAAKDKQRCQFQIPSRPCQSRCRNQSHSPLRIPFRIPSRSPRRRNLRRRSLRRARRINPRCRSGACPGWRLLPDRPAPSAPEPISEHRLGYRSRA